MGGSFPASERRAANELYGLTLDEQFQAAQLQPPGDPHAALANLRSTVPIALDRDDLVEAIGCVGAYRTSKLAKELADSVKDALARGQWTLALGRAEHYAQDLDWGRALHLFVAWRAAEAGDLDAVGHA